MKASSDGKNGFEVARAGDVVYVRVHGLGNMSNAPVLKAFSDKMIEEGYRRFIVDLENCRGIDSTFMGTLLDTATSAREGDKPTKRSLKDSDPGDPGVLLVNVDDHCKKQLTSVGLDAFLPVAPDRASLPKGVELRVLEIKDVSAQERLKLILKAHQELVAIDQRNEAKFGAFLKDLLADLGQL
ncbi:MAG TPA: STAS domain-containing protein [Planctomycetota bacterium]|nr:STAS domain-containing protein [Planctomycetota bacterium]